jgi:hypothetical protein
MPAPKPRAPAPRTRPPNRHLRVVGATLGLAAVLAVALGLLATRGGTASSALPALPASPLPGELTATAPWPANIAELAARLAALRLPALLQEGTALHIHQHLDVYVDGRHVTVPSGIGIDVASGFISPLHTHDTSGVMHVESPDIKTFTLGQFFAVWGVRLSGRCVGGYCNSGPRRVRVYVDGRRVTGDPRQLALAEHQEIAVTYGTPAQLPSPIPQSYDFPVGL